MKRTITTAAAVLLTLSISHGVSAHSNLGASNPADGEVITEPLNEITLEFDGQIEQGSFIDVATTSGQAVELQDIIIGDGTLTGTVAEPLGNDEYQVNWSIISADGHPLNGEFSFTVNVPVAEAEEETSEEPTTTTETAEDKTKTDSQSTQEPEITAADKTEEGSSSTLFLIAVLLIVMIAGGLFFFRKKRK